MRAARENAHKFTGFIAAVWFSENRVARNHHGVGGKHGGGRFAGVFDDGKTGFGLFLCRSHHVVGGALVGELLFVTRTVRENLSLPHRKNFEVFNPHRRKNFAAAGAFARKIKTGHGYAR